MAYHKIKLLFSFIVLTSFASVSSSLCLDIARWSPQQIAGSVAIGLAALNAGQLGFQSYHFYQKHSNSTMYSDAYTKAIDNTLTPLRNDIEEFVEHKKGVVNALGKKIQLKTIALLEQEVESDCNSYAKNNANAENNNEILLQNEIKKVRLKTLKAANANLLSSKTFKKQQKKAPSLLKNEIVTHCQDLEIAMFSTMVERTSNPYLNLVRSLPGIESSYPKFKKNRSEHLNLTEEPVNKDNHFYNLFFAFFNSDSISFLTFIGSFMFGGLEYCYNKCYPKKLPSFQDIKYTKTKALVDKSINPIRADQINAINIVAKSTSFQEGKFIFNEVLSPDSIEDNTWKFFFFGGFFDSEKTQVITINSIRSEERKKERNEALSNIKQRKQQQSS